MAPRTSLFVNKQSGGMFAVEDMSLTTGNRFYVDSGSSTNGTTAAFGKSPDSPFSSIEACLNASVLTANNGDVIIVMPGHAETVSAAAGLDIDSAGVWIRGLGHGTDKPTITLDTAATADVDIDAANVRLTNLRFVSDIDSLAVMLDVNSANLLVEDCDFVTSSAKECVNFINLATTVDNFTFRRCTFYQPTDPDGTDDAAATGCFYYVDSENILIDHCRFNGFFETSIFHNKTTAAKEVWITHCEGSQLLSGANVADIVATGTGGMVHCGFLVSNAADATTEGEFVTIGAASPFGFHNTTFMNDNAAGGNNALAVTASMA